MGGYDMIIQEFSIDGYDWILKIYYIISGYSIEDILFDLNDLGCSNEDIDETIDMLQSGDYDIAVTHSNIYERKSVVIICPSSSAREFLDTLTHEVGHISMHISIADSINPLSEEVQYIAGYIAKQAFEVCHKFLCDECREHTVE